MNDERRAPHVYQMSAEHAARFLEADAHLQGDDRVRMMAIADELRRRFPGPPGGDPIDVAAALVFYGLPPLRRLHTDPNEAKWRGAHLIVHEALHGGVRCRVCREWVR